MTEQASFEPKMLHAEQVSEQSEPEKPWLRQRNEPAAWFMRFQIYKDLGTKRSLRAAVAKEPETNEAIKGNKRQQETSEQKNLKVSVPGSWSRASKVWNWKVRAEAWDLAEQAKQATYIRETANKTRFASRSYRIIQLDYTARVLKYLMPPSGIPIPDSKVSHYLAIFTRYQSVMRDIRIELEELNGVTLDACDAAAFKAIKEEIEKYEASKPATIDYRQR